ETAPLVQRAEAGQRVGRDRDRGSIVVRVRRDAADDARSAAVRDQDGAAVPGENEELADRGRVGRARDRVGNPPEPAASQGDPVGQALAASVADAVDGLERQATARVIVEYARRKAGGDVLETGVGGR